VQRAAASVHPCSKTEGVVPPHHGWIVGKEEALVDGLAGFVTLAVLLTVTPGPDDVLVVRSSLRGGFRLGTTTAAGVATGTLAWGAITAVGLAALFSRSSDAYDVLRIAGGGFLVLVGTVPLLARQTAWAGSAAPGRTPSHRAPSRWPGAGAAFTVGLFSDLLNPKIGLFYLAVVPQFVPPAAPVLPYSLLLCAIDITVATVWLIGLSWLARRAVDLLQRPSFALWSQRLLSACLIGLGLSAALGGQG
jgi:threonine/homoserine/homoserine lactone efflux protein